jgi:hypothetical protein
MNFITPKFYPLIFVLILFVGVVYAPSITEPTSTVTANSREGLNPSRQLFQGETPTETFTPSVSPTRTASLTWTPTTTCTPPCNPPTYTPSKTDTPTGTWCCTETPSNTPSCTFTASIPNLYFPTHRSHTTDKTPTFSWQRDFGAKSYRIFIFTEDRSFTWKARLFTHTYTMTSPLLAGKYLWRIRAQDLDCNTWSRWSRRWVLFVD